MGYRTVVCSCFLGSVGKPFPNVEVCIAKPNVYVPTGYDVVARGNSVRTTVTPGISVCFAFCFVASVPYLSISARQLH